MGCAKDEVALDQVSWPSLVILLSYWVLLPYL